MSDAKAAQAGGAFEALLGELDTMTKALPAGDGDAAIAAAAGGTGESGGKKAGGTTTGEKGDKGKSAGGTEDDELDEDGKPIMKSFKTIIDGKEVDAVDGTELVKSLIARVDETDKKVGESEDIVAKALTSTLSIVKAQAKQLEQQATLIKALQESIGEIGTQGRGRKTLLAIAEKPGVLAKSEDGGMTQKDFMLKANQAFDKKMISGQELTIIDVSLRQGVAIDEGVVNRVLGAA